MRRLAASALLEQNGDSMRESIAVLLIAVLLIPFPLFAGLDSKKAAYQGGTTKDKDFPTAKKAVEGNLSTSDETELKFEYTLDKMKKTYAIPYNQFRDIEYGQKAGRRVGASIATAVLINPVGLFMLLSKKRKHFVTISYTDEAAKEQVAVFELGKDLVRTTLPILETRSGKKIIYQDEEAEKSGKGN
jgi:hypothetical protein